ncbi:hypothetical protein KUF57_21830 [Mycolicibacterium sp. PAM1]|uniref:hypothetical protein n=1 Tax=Mycolicibacterium sp. PAM1 TaxID=2853535 RepID=UPI001C3D1B61|nr:hypothetical protein [Mycolicibacterium sp. PAM1]MBV5246183.1 hypothetical protein [Mycolicibacterium sp. PAM1]
MSDGLPVAVATPLRCGAAALMIVLAAAGCSSAPEHETSAHAAATAPALTGSLDDWRAAICRDDVTAVSGTRHTVEGSTCVPHDGDGVVNFDRFESEPSMSSMLSWQPSVYVAHAVVDDRPLAIWTPSGEASDLEPLTRYGFTLAAYESPTLSRPTGELPATVPSGDIEVIPPNAYGYVVVQTAGGDTQCLVDTTYVGCETEGTNWQQHLDGSGPYHGVRINADGTGSWVDGNLGAAAPQTLGDRTYRALGWTIVSSPAGMRFTNDRTGHGAIVSAAKVQTF